MEWQVEIGWLVFGLIAVYVVSRVIKSRKKSGSRTGGSGGGGGGKRPPTHPK